MQYREYGDRRAPVVMLLHGGGLSWWNYREEARLLQDDFRVILPVLDGHAGSDRPFTTIEDNASGILSFIDGHLGGSVLLIGGLSLGGQVLLEMLSQRNSICRYAMVESASVLPSRATHALIGPAFGSSYALIRNRAFAKLQFRSLRIRPDLFEEYYRDTCRIGKGDMIAFLKANTAYTLKSAVSGTSAEVRVFAGEKEKGGILRSADIICRMIPGSRKAVMPGLYHGEFSLNHPKEYAQAVREIVGR